MKLSIHNSKGKRIGEIAVTSRKRMLVPGIFSAAEFQSYEGLFREFECAVDDQLFNEVDRLEEVIHSLNLYVADSSLEKKYIQNRRPSNHEGRSELSIEIELILAC